MRVGRGRALGARSGVPITPGHARNSHRGSTTAVMRPRAWVLQLGGGRVAICARAHDRDKEEKRNKFNTQKHPYTRQQPIQQPNSVARLSCYSCTVLVSSTAPTLMNATHQNLMFAQIRITLGQTTKVGIGGLQTVSGVTGTGWLNSTLRRARAWAAVFAARLKLLAHVLVLFFFKAHRSSYF